MAKGKASLAAQVTPRCEQVAARLGFELVDVETERDATGLTLRIYVDRPEGMDLDGCERFHRAIQPLVEDFDYDYLEVSSPGIDRPLKKDADFARALGSEVVIHFFRAQEGSKEARGILGRYLFPGKEAMKPVHSLSGGEKTRLALAELLESRPNFLILDEPSNHCDIKTQEEGKP